jgi:protein-L-isoaspartate(D-aspartate) O-methyltransferase
VEAAFRAVPRHLFVPDVPVEEAYRDQWIVTKRVGGEAVSSSSSPEIMAVMLEQLALEPGHRVLEIGAGTGYSAALLSHIVGERGTVVTVDIDADTVAAARAHLEAAGFARVDVVCADDGFGHAPGAPYDRIILTAGAWDLAPAWREQLVPAGRLVVPLAVGGVQKTIAFAPADDHLASVAVRDCLFMPLRGAFAGPGKRLPVGSGTGSTSTSPPPARMGRRSSPSSRSRRTRSRPDSR